MLKIAVCEDERKDKERLLLLLRKYKAEYGMDISIDTYTNGEELLSKFCNQYDIIFMEVVLDGLDGIKTAKQIRKTDSSTAIIYTTYNNTYAIDSYGVDASDYLMKPLTYAHLKRALKKAVTFVRQKKYRVLINNKDTLCEVSLYDVFYIEYEARMLKIYKVTGEIIEFKGTLKAMLEEDKEELLIKINKYQLVNRIWIDKCEEGKIYLKDGSCLCVSRERWKGIKEIYIKESHIRNS